MADKTVNIDGLLTLDQTRARCVVEQNKGFSLTSIQNATISQGGQVLQVNKAEFKRDLDFLPELLFVEPGANKPDEFKDQKKNQGWTFLCSGAIYVQNNIANVMVFGK